MLALLLEQEKYDLEAANGSSRIRSHYSLNYLRLPVMLRYTYPRGKLSPFLEFGVSASYALKANNSSEQAYFGRTNYVPSQDALSGPSFRSQQLGVGAGLGLSSRLASGRTVALQVRAEETDGFSNIYGAGTYVLHLYGLLSFDLTK